MTVKFGQLKKSLKQGGASKKKTHEPPSFVYRDSAQYPDLAIESRFFKIRPEFLRNGNKGSLFFVAVVKSEDPNRGSRLKTKNPDVKPAYKVTIKFEDIIFKDVPTEGYDTELKLSSGKVKYYKKPNFSRKGVRLKCQCADFRHRFEHQLAKEGALFGPPRKYKRKTQPWKMGGRPYANQTNKIGFCKHVNSFHNFLVKFGYCTER